jgi:hypothetical protein
MNIISYIVAYVIGVVAIVVGATNPANNGKAFIAFGIYAILMTTWAGLWSARGTFRPDFKNKGLIAKFTEVGEAVTIPAIIGLIIVIIIALV